MRIGSRSRILSFGIVAALAVAALAYDYKPPELPPASHANKYLLHEAHKNEGLSIAIDPYGSDKDSVFHLKFREHRLLPVRLIISNDTDQPISLADADIEFTTSRRAKAPPLSLDDVERAIANSAEPQDRASTRVPLPIPLPKHKAKRLPKDAEQEIDYLIFKAKAVEPHTTQSGFLFFNTGNVSEPLSGTHILFTGIRNAEGQELFYFDIPLSRSDLTAVQ
jgi:hypothetical protein